MKINRFELTTLCHDIKGFEWTRRKVYILPSDIFFGVFDIKPPEKITHSWLTMNGIEVEPLSGHFPIIIKQGISTQVLIE